MTDFSRYIDANYDDFMPSLLSNEVLIDEGRGFEEELLSLKDNLSNETKHVYESSDEISKLVEDLEVANKKLNLSMKLMKIDKLLGQIKRLNETDKHTDINIVLNSIERLLSDPEDTIIRRLDVYTSMKQRLTFERTNMLENLKSRFQSLVQMKEKAFLKTKAVSMTISNDSNKLSDCINAIIESDFNSEEITDFLMSNIFEPLICRPASLTFEENDLNFKMSLSFSTEPISEELRPSYLTVFQNLGQVILYLDKMNMQLNNGEFFLAHIFQERRKELLDMIYSQCLVHSIPKTFEEKNQCSMKTDIGTLDDALIDNHFFSADGGVKLDDYATMLDSLFFEQFTRSIQSTASELLKRDLHDMMLVSEDSSITTNTPLSFPRSMVSKSTFELIRLLEKVILEAKNCMDDSDKENNLLLSVQAVLSNYSFAVQLHHSKFMSKIPQQSALFYNNCMYLSKWVCSNVDIDRHGVESIVSELEKQGWEVLECQIAKQKIQLLELLNEFGKPVYSTLMNTLMIICFPIRPFAKPHRSQARTFQAHPSVLASNGLAEERLADDFAFRAVQHDRRRIAGCHLLERR